MACTAPSTAGVSGPVRILLNICLRWVFLAGTAGQITCLRLQALLIPMEF